MNANFWSTEPDADRIDDNPALIALRRRGPFDAVALPPSRDRPVPRNASFVWRT
jgi:hypothetical protein